MEKVLIVIDMQNDFIDGSLGTPKAQAIVNKVVAKIEEFRKENNTIYFTKDTHHEDYLNTLEGKYLPVKHCEYATHGWYYVKEIAYILDPYINAISIPKNTFGFINWPDYLGKDFNGTIEICGLCTDICVVSNALILRTLYPNVEIICDANCCAGSTPERHKEALDVMRSCQIQIVNNN